MPNTKQKKKKNMWADVRPTVKVLVAYTHNARHVKSTWKQPLCMNPTATFFIIIIIMSLLHEYHQYLCPDGALPIAFGK